MNSGRRIALFLLIFGLAGVAMAQDANLSDGAAYPSQPQHVIVSWTHFGDDPSPAPVSSDAALQPRTVSPGSRQPEKAGPSQSSSAGQPPASQSAEPAVTSPNVQVYEADISKKHPHGPELIQLPPADQVYQIPNSELSIPPSSTPSADQSYQIPNSQLSNPPSSTPSQASAVEPSAATPSELENAAASPPPNQSPEDRVTFLATRYQDRATEREGEINQLATVATKDPSNQGLALIQGTRLQLEGAQDLMTTSQQLAQAYAGLADELSDRAGKVQALADSRKQTALTAAAELNQVKDLAPRRETALRNLSFLPANQQNNQMIQSLSAELTQEESDQKIDEAQTRQARIEMQDLQAQAGKLQQAAAEARRESGAFARAAQDARQKENRLADRLEFYAARQRAADTLATASKVLGNSPLLNSASAPDASVDSVRACIRSAGNTDACLTKSGNP